MKKAKNNKPSKQRRPSNIERSPDGDCPRMDDEKSFIDMACGLLDFAVDPSGEDMLDWSVVSKLFHDLAKAYNPEFFLTRVRKMSGTDAERQKKRDELVAKRQEALAKALSETDRDLAGRYADVLRRTPAPPGIHPLDAWRPFLYAVESLNREVAEKPRVADYVDNAPVVFFKQCTIILCPFANGEKVKMKKSLKSKVLRVLFETWQADKSVWRDWDEVKKRAGVSGSEPEPYRFMEDRSGKNPEYSRVFREIIKQEKINTPKSVLYKVMLNPQYAYILKP